MTQTCLISHELHWKTSISYNYSCCTYQFQHSNMPSFVGLHVFIQSNIRLDIKLQRCTPTITITHINFSNQSLQNAYFACFSHAILSKYLSFPQIACAHLASTNKLQRYNYTSNARIP